MLRPRATRWFEILAARDDATLVLEALARTGAVELEARSGAPLPADPAEVTPLLAAFSELSSRCRPYWPEPQQLPALGLPRSPGADAAALPGHDPCLGPGGRAGDPQGCSAPRPSAANCSCGSACSTRRARSGVDPCHLAGAGPLVSVRLFVLPAGTEPASVLPTAAPGLELLTRTLLVDGQPHLLVAGRPEALQALAQRVSLLKGSMHALPAWLQADAMANRRHVQQALERIERELADGHATLQDLDQRHALACALGDVHRVQWVLDNVKSLESGALLCWITGWTSDSGGDALSRALEQCRARALLHHAAAPAQSSAPLLLRNPPWARPFEIFSRALGMPASSEADPTPLLAIVVPLMFGYMFGDVGQGLVIAAAGWWYRKRFPIARLLMVGGLSAAAFGLLFGSVFSLHGVLPALWLHPLDRPLAVLPAPLFGGALLLTLGLGLDALASWWRREMRRWLLTDAALIVVYLGLLAAFAERARPGRRRRPARSGSASAMAGTPGAGRRPSAPSASWWKRRCRS